MITRTVREFLVREFFPGEVGESLRDDQPLLSSGLLDSVAALKLVLFLEQHFAIAIDTSDISGGRINTLESIAALVNEKGPTRP